jgi:hypothetical protein
MLKLVKSNANNRAVFLALLTSFLSCITITLDLLSMQLSAEQTHVLLGYWHLLHISRLFGVSLFGKLSASF